MARIIKVKDLIERSPCLHYFILPIVNEKGIRVAVGAVADCGLWIGVECRSEGLKSKPYKTEKQVKELVQRTHGRFIEINEMERVNIRSSRPHSGPFSPLWKVKTHLGILFVDYFEDNVYRIEVEMPSVKGLPLADFLRHESAIHDPLNDRMYLLRKIEK